MPLPTGMQSLGCTPAAGCNGGSVRPTAGASKCLGHDANAQALGAVRTGRASLGLAVILPPFHLLPWGRQVTGQGLQRAPRCGLCIAAPGWGGPLQRVGTRAKLLNGGAAGARGALVKETLPDGSGP